MGFLLGLLAWFGVSPGAFGRSTSKYVFKSWGTGFAFLAFFTNLVVLIFAARSHSQSWVYLSLSWSILFLAFMYVNALFPSFKIGERIFQMMAIIVPIPYFFVAFLMLDYALQPKNAGNAWEYIIGSAVYIFIAGAAFGANIIMIMIDKRMKRTAEEIKAVDKRMDKIMEEHEALKNILELSTKSKVNTLPPKKS